MINWQINSVEEWNQIAREVVDQLHDGDILTLSGSLGAGKTTFVQVLAQTLGSERIPKSPTFSMLRTYPISKNDLKRLLHVDAYRIENEMDLVTLDLDEELSIPGTILVLEWPEKIPQWLSMRSHKELRIEVEGERRLVEFVG